jgi:sarcosine/dimethylglycine N-methyltransferase
MSEAAAVAQIAEQYYDSRDADEFYYRIWGGEDIHIGLYEFPEQPVRDASRATVALMADQLQGISKSSRVLDIGAGYGGAGRYLASRFGCHVTCLNLSETQNTRNREMTAKAGLDRHVEVVHGNFEDLPFGNDAYDVVWSQDAILHSGNRFKVLDEVTRVLRPSGQFLFTDPMQADNCPAGVLGPVLARIHLDTLGSFAFYREALSERGYSEQRVIQLTQHLGRHYSRVRAELSSHYDDMVERASKVYVDRMLEGLSHWVSADEKGYLAWGILYFQAP